MGIDPEIALGLEGEVQPAVINEKAEHMIEEGNACTDGMLPRSIQINFQNDLCLFGLAPHHCLAMFFHGFLSLAWTARSWPSSPSHSVNRFTSSANRLRAGRVNPNTFVLFTKSSTPKGEKKRAVPAVGRM
jgi:hypothetical protein